MVSGHGGGGPARAHSRLRGAPLHARVQTSVLCHHTALGAPDLDSTHKARARAGDNQTLAGNAGFLLRTLVSSSGQTRPGSCNGEKPTFQFESPNPAWTPATLGLSSQATGIGRTSGKGTRKPPHCLSDSSERRGRGCRVCRRTSPSSKARGRPWPGLQSQEGPFAERPPAQGLLPNRSPRTHGIRR